MRNDRTNDQFHREDCMNVQFVVVTLITFNRRLYGVGADGDNKFNIASSHFSAVMILKYDAK